MWLIRKRPLNIVFCCLFTFESAPDQRKHPRLPFLHIDFKTTPLPTRGRPLSETASKSRKTGNLSTNTYPVWADHGTKWCIFKLLCATVKLSDLPCEDIASQDQRRPRLPHKIISYRRGQTVSKTSYILRSEITT